MKKLIFLILLATLISCKKDHSTSPSSVSTSSSSGSNLILLFSYVSASSIPPSFSINGTPYPFPVMNIGGSWGEAGETNYPEPNNQGYISFPYVSSGNVIYISCNDTAKEVTYAGIIMEVINENGIEGAWGKPWNQYNYSGSKSWNSIDTGFYSPSTFNLTVTIP